MLGVIDQVSFPAIIDARVGVVSRGLWGGMNLLICLYDIIYDRDKGDTGNNLREVMYGSYSEESLVVSHGLATQCASTIR